MTILTRFPSRIRFVNPDGTLTPEAARLLDTLISRAGDGLGDAGDDIFAAASTGDGAALPTLDIVAPAITPGYMAPVDLQPASQGHITEMTIQGSSE